jgi:hypothetical protein
MFFSNSLLDSGVMALWAAYTLRKPTFPSTTSAFGRAELDGVCLCSVLGSIVRMFDAAVTSTNNTKHDAREWCYTRD